MKELGIAGLNAGGQMTDAALERLSELDHVSHLNLLSSSRVTDEGLRHLARMPQLLHLDLSGWDMQITDRGLEVLRHLSALRELRMCWPRRLSDAGMANLASCDHLESVNLLGTPTGDGAIKALTSKRGLRTFHSGNQVTDAGVALLVSFRYPRPGRVVRPRSP